MISGEDKKRIGPSDLTGGEPRRLMLRYRGGGCRTIGNTWAWNYGYYDEQGLFWDLFSFGKWACHDTDQVQEMLGGEDFEWGEDAMVYDFSDLDEVEDFADTVTVDALITMAYNLLDMPVDLELRGRCSICGELKDPMDCEAAGGFGQGITCFHEALVCSDCFGPFCDEDDYNVRGEAADRAHFKHLEENPPKPRECRRSVPEPQR